MKERWLALAVVLPVLALGVGCAASADKSGYPYGERDAGAAAGDGGFAHDAGADGATSNKQDGAASSSDAGAPGGDTGAAHDASGSDTTPPTCSVSIVPLSPPRLTDLTAGPTATLRVHGEIVGSAPPASPTWDWSVHFNQATAVPVVKDATDPATIQFALSSPGQFTIDVTVAANCTGKQVALAQNADKRTDTFWIRMLPPPPGSPDALPPGANAPAQETTVLATHGKALSRDLVLETFPAVPLDPHRSGGIVLPSYIRISSAGSLISLEGYTSKSLAFPLKPLIPYDVLIIPDGDFAPALFAQQRPDALRALDLTLDQGALIEGMVGGPGGNLQQSRVLLRAGSLPSTVGTADANGRFSLWVRAGAFSATFQPPRGSSLPEAHVENALALAAPLPASIVAGFIWGAPDNTRLELTVHGIDDGVPAQPIDVRLESETAELPNVGTLTVGQNAPLAATGVMRVEGTTGSDGVVVFASLPRARYQTTLVPRGPLTGSGTTTVEVDARAATPVIVTTVRLQGRVKVTGRLLPADRSVGVKVVAIDSATGLTATSPAAIVDTAGRFVLDCDPGRTYHLFAEPDAARALPRTALGELKPKATDDVFPDRMLPSGLEMIGRVLWGANEVKGAVIQAFCIGAPPDCVDPNGRRTDAIRPIAETVSTASGAYRLVLPDPGTGD